MAVAVTPTRKKRLALVWLLVAVGVAGFILANIHLIYVSFKSEPACVPHLKSSGAATGSYRAANSDC